MRFNHVTAGNTTVSELVGEGALLNTEDDALDLMMSAGARFILVHGSRVNPDFSRVATGPAGAVLQKFTMYAVRLAIVGDISPFMTKNFDAFFRESNRCGDYLFLPATKEAIRRWTEPPAVKRAIPARGTSLNSRSPDRLPTGLWADPGIEGGV